MTSVFPDPITPYPGWERRIYRHSRPVTKDDIQIFLGSEDLYVRDTTACPEQII